MPRHHVAHTPCTIPRQSLRQRASRTIQSVRGSRLEFARRKLYQGKLDLQNAISPTSLCRMSTSRQWKVIRRTSATRSEGGRITYGTEAVAGPFTTEAEAMRWIVHHPELGPALAVEPIVMPRRQADEGP